MALLPTFPQGKLVNKDGEMNDQWKMFFSQLHIELRKTVNQEGMLMPQQSGNNILKLNTPKSISNLLYDKDAQAMKLNNLGTFQEIYTRPQELTSAQIAAIPSNKVQGTWVYNTDATHLLYGISGLFREVAYT